MKVFYYCYGFITALFIFAILFNMYYEEILNEYWIKVIHQKYWIPWYYTRLLVGTLITSFVLIWVYNLGRGAKELEEKESLLIKKEEKEDE